MHSENLSSKSSWTIDLVAGEPSRRVDFDGVIDLSGLGELVGVEILDFKRQTGAMTPGCIGDAPPRCGYDAEIDAFYVRIAEGNSPIQKKARGTVALDADNHILGLTIILIEG